MDTSGSDNRELKAKLVEELRRRPNPDEKQLEEFLQIIKDHEAMLRTRDHYQTQSSGKNKERTQTNEEWIRMNDSTEKVTTQKIEVCESRMNAEVGICETNDEWTGVNESTGKVMTQTKIEASERMKCELDSDDRAKCEEETDDKVIVATKEESSRNADEEESKVSEGHWPDWRSVVRLLTGVLSCERV